MMTTRRRQRWRLHTPAGFFAADAPTKLPVLRHQLYRQPFGAGDPPAMTGSHWLTSFMGGEWFEYAMWRP
jgi:hypothetical protein